MIGAEHGVGALTRVHRDAGGDGAAAGIDRGHTAQIELTRRAVAALAVDDIAVGKDPLDAAGVEIRDGNVASQLNRVGLAAAVDGGANLVASQDDGVVARAAIIGISAGAAVQRVVAAAAVQHIGAAAAVQRIVTALAVQHVVAVFAVQRVVLVGAEHGVGALTRVHRHAGGDGVAGTVDRGQAAEIDLAGRAIAALTVDLKALGKDALDAGGVEVRDSDIAIQLDRIGLPAAIDGSADLVAAHQDGVVPGSAQDRIRTAAAVYRVVTAAAIDHVRRTARHRGQRYNRHGRIDDRRRDHFTCRGSDKYSHHESPCIGQYLSDSSQHHTIGCPDYDFRVSSPDCLRQ